MRALEKGYILYTMPIHKIYGKVRRRAGRPALDGKTRKVREEQGDRLREAINRRSVDQTTMERRCSIPQETISRLISGKAPLNTDYLTKLSKAGISADYLLGTRKEDIPVGSTRTQAELENDLTAQIYLRVNDEIHKLPLHQQPFEYEHFDELEIISSALIPFLTEQVLAEANRWQHYLRAHANTASTRATAEQAATDLRQLAEDRKTRLTKKQRSRFVQVSRATAEAARLLQVSLLTLELKTSDPRPRLVWADPSKLATGDAARPQGDGVPLTNNNRGKTR